MPQAEIIAGKRGGEEWLDMWDMEVLGFGEVERHREVVLRCSDDLRDTALSPRIRIPTYWREIHQFYCLEAGVKGCEGVCLCVRACIRVWLSACVYACLCVGIWVYAHLRKGKPIQHHSFYVYGNVYFKLTSVGSLWNEKCLTA